MPPKKSELVRQYSEDDETLHYQQAMETIDQRYTERIFKFMRGEISSVCSSQEFINMYGIMVMQCNHDDRAQRVYAYYVEKLTTYVRTSMLPYVKAQTAQGHIMQAFIKVWHDFAMVTKMMERVFGYLDRFYLKEFG